MKFWVVQIAVCLSFFFGSTFAQSLKPRAGFDRPLKDSMLLGEETLGDDLFAESDDPLFSESESKSEKEFSPRKSAPSEPTIGNARENRADKMRVPLNSKISDGNHQNVNRGPNVSDRSDRKTRDRNELQTESNRSQRPDRKKISEPEPKSQFENIFLGKFPTFVSRDLTQFGYDIFSQRPSSFMPLEDIPISPDYVVGPGDSFTINVWGSNNFSTQVTVRRDGTVFVPKVGSIRVWGQTYKEMTTAIQKRLTQFYSGIKVNISFDSIRLIDVFVIGEVKQPGSYSISSTSSPINALFHAGGPTKNGSLRNIQILRNNQIIESVDLYNFLISGKADRQSLQSQDVILVPVIGKMVAIAGSVKRPAVYELKGPANLYDIITMAGGLTFTGQTGRLSLERVEKNKERVTRDFLIPETFGTLPKEKMPMNDLATSVEDGDLIQIFPVLTTLKKTVYLRGHVKRPGSYEFKPGMTIKSLIPSFETLLPDPYTDYAQIIRELPPKTERQSIFAPLQLILDGDPLSDIPLQEGDEIVVFSKEELNLRDTVSIAGKVNKPGEYLFFKGMKLRDLIFMAGNITQDAYLANAEIARYRTSGDELKLDRLQVNLREALSSDGAKQNYPLEPKDKVFIQGLPNWQIENFMSITGEVRYPGQYPFIPGEKLSSVIERAGGFTKKAFLSGAVFTRQSVKMIQEKALKEQVSQLEEAVLQESVRPQNMTAADLQTFQAATVARKDMLKKLQSAEVSGRMLIHLSDLPQLKGGSFDVPLEPKDALEIPMTPSVVTISGEVFNPASMVFVEGKTVQYYLERAGGSTPNADNESIFVVKADGTVVSKRQNRGFLLRNFYQTEIERGDAILVPKDITQFSWLNTTKDITEILFKIASTTGITITALK